MIQYILIKFLISPLLYHKIAIITHFLACNPGIHHDQLGLRQGDRRSISVASASIVAKVLRDQMVSNLDDVYEGYAFAKHKGYGTKDHFRALDEKGPTVFHRFSFRPLNQEKG